MSAPTERAGPMVVVQEGVEPTGIAEYFGLSRLMADGLGKAERPFAMTEGVGVAALGLGQC